MSAITSGCEDTTSGFAKVRRDLGEIKSSYAHDERAGISYASMKNELSEAFKRGVTKSIEWRKHQLRQMHRAFVENHEKITEAVRADLGGPKFRGLVENTTASAITHCLEHIDAWTEPEYVKHNSFFGKSLVRKEPKGVVLLISPWNYPINLVFKPLASIVAAGNCCVIKPSEMSPHCAKVIQELVERYLDPSCFRVVQGAVPETTALLNLRWDHILYTGNGSVAKVIMRAAARNLVPVTLELGGKSPVIIDETAKMHLAVRRVAFGKWLNVGQTCVSPDFVLVHRSRMDEFLGELKKVVVKMYGKTPQTSNDYGRIIHPRHAERIRCLLESTKGDVVMGGAEAIDVERKFVPPTIVVDPPLTDSLMREEIFGPVLPVRSFDSIDGACETLNAVCSHPLALYIFSESPSNIDRVLNRTTSGGVGVNCVMEQLHDSLPFGGIGESGMGSYGGRWGFEEFSHFRAVMHKDTTFLGTGVLLPPYSASVYDYGTKYLVTGFFTEAQRRIMRALALASGVSVVAFLLRRRISRL